MQVLWFFPSGGDGRYLGTQIGHREASFDYMKQIAITIDDLGYYGALLPTGLACEDSVVLGSALIPLTKRLKFLIAARPSVVTPAVAAHTAASFDRFSNGRLLINIVTGSAKYLPKEGVYIEEDERYELTDEFLTIWRDLLRGNEVTFHGKHLKIDGGKNHFAPIQKPYPPLYFGGSSPNALRVAGKHVDVYLTWANQSPEETAEKLAVVRRHAQENGRTIRFGIRLHVIVRETEAEAWRAASDLIRHIDDDTIAAVQRMRGDSEHAGIPRILAEKNYDRDSLVISPNLWAGVGLVRGGAATALVGDPYQVAARMKEYVDLGIDSFVLGGYPHLEEAIRFAELVFPLLPLDHSDGLTTDQPAPRAEPRSVPNEFGSARAGAYGLGDAGLGSPHRTAEPGARVPVKAGAE